MRVARPVVLNTEQRDLLESRARARSASARSVERARILLLAAGGMQDKQIAAKLKIMPEKAARWRNRFLDGGLAALDKDAPRPGRPSTIINTGAAQSEVPQGLKPVRSGPFAARLKPCPDTNRFVR